MELLKVPVYVNGYYIGPECFNSCDRVVTLEVWTGETTAERHTAKVMWIDGRLRADFNNPRLTIENGKVWLNASKVLKRWERPAFTKHMKVSRPRAGRIK